MKEKMKLILGIRDGTLFHISEVESGLACNCFCPSCNHPLVARKGGKVSHHFAHMSGKECESYVETSLHIAAKEMLEKQKKIVVPKVYIELPCYSGTIKIAEEMELKFDKVLLEKKTGNIVPDVIGYINGKPLIIEITVTHKTNEKKVEKARKQGISILEIDLSNYCRSFSMKELEKEIINNTENKRWLLNLKKEKKEQKIWGKFGAKTEEEFFEIFNKLVFGD